MRTEIFTGKNISCRAYSGSLRDFMRQFSQNLPAMKGIPAFQKDKTHKKIPMESKLTKRL
jgi:hypothetical protein